MLECESCRLNGLKCILACVSVRLAILTLYGFVLALLSGTIIWFSTSRNLPEVSGVILATVFLGIELMLLLKGTITIGSVLTFILFGPLVHWIMRQHSYKPVSESGDKLIRKALLARNVAIAA